MKIEDITRQYRAEHGLSQRQFAAQCGLSSTYIWYLEQGIHPQTGKRIQPSIPALNKIARGMGITFEELMSKCDNMLVSELSNNADYARVVLQKFVKAVYLYDDDIRVDCWYGEGIVLNSPIVDHAPPYITRSNISAFAEFFSFRM